VRLKPAMLMVMSRDARYSPSIWACSLSAGRVSFPFHGDRPDAALVVRNVVAFLLLLPRPKVMALADRSIYGWCRARYE
jgi:hypothetical protein